MEAMDHSGHTPLTVAIQTGCHAKVRFLLSWERILPLCRRISKSGNWLHEVDFDLALKLVHDAQQRVELGGVPDLAQAT